MKQVYFKTADAWRDWLAQNHNSESEVWLIFYKKKSGQPSIAYEAAVEEALCFGWIDSLIKKVDEASYARKFTPRNEDSKWSPLNKKRVARLIKSGRMTGAGQAKVEAAKQSGLWDQPDRPDLDFKKIPPAFQQALAKNKAARDFFDQLAPSYRKQFIGWISVAKRPETKAKRIEESIELLAKGEKLGLR